MMAAKSRNCCQKEGVISVKCVGECRRDRVGAVGEKPCENGLRGELEKRNWGQEASTSLLSSSAMKKSRKVR